MEAAAKPNETRDNDAAAGQDDLATLDGHQDLRSYVESAPAKKPSGAKKPRAQTAIPRTRKNKIEQNRQREEAMSQLSGAPADQTRSQTGVSAASASRSYITHLEHELNQERAARERLQSDIE